MSKRCTAFDTRYNIDDNDLVLLKSLDPTGSKCLYLDFIYRQYIQGYLLREEFEEMRSYLQLFEDNKSHLKEKDINAYNLISLRELFYVTLSNNIKDNGSVNTLYDGPYGTLSIPLTHDASCKLGSGTKWCTSSKGDEETFLEYHEDGLLYVWYDNNWNKGTLKELGNRSKKFQFHFETATFMDEYDNNIGNEILVYFIRDHPVISLIFEEYEQYMRDDSSIVRYVIRIDPDDEMGYITKYILNNTNREKIYIDTLRKKHITDLDREIFSKYLEDEQLLIKIAALDEDVLYKYIYTNTDRSYVFAMQRYKSIGIEEIDRNILSNPNYTYKYLMIMQDIPPNIPSDNIVIRAIVNREKYINIAELDKIDHKAALLYATDVLRSRCPIVEHDLEKMDKYTRLFLMPKLVPGNEEMYLKSIQYLTLEDYREYYNKYGRSDVIDKHLIGREDYHTLTEIAIYLYKAPLSCCMIHLDKDIENKAIVKNINSMYDMYMYVFYGIGKAQNTEWLLRRMLIHGESKELCDELINMKIVRIEADGYNSLDGLTRESLKYINDNTTKFFMKMLTYVYLEERPVSFDNLIKQNFDEDTSNDDLIAYSLYWKKFFKCVKMPIFENANGRYDIYLNNYKGKIDKYEKKAYIPDFYLSSRVSI